VLCRTPISMVSETLSDKARRVLLKLDSGCLIGSAEKLRVSSADGTAAVLVDADHSFQLGRLAEKDVQRLEDMLLKMHAKIPGAAPLRTNSSAISSLKRKASDLYQVRVCDPRGGFTRVGKSIVLKQQAVMRLRARRMRRPLVLSQMRMDTNSQVSSSASESALFVMQGLPPLRSPTSSFRTVSHCTLARCVGRGQTAACAHLIGCSAPEHALTNAGGGYSEPVTPRDESGWAKGQFEHKCLSIMQSCWTEFGEFIIYFNEPVC